MSHVSSPAALRLRLGTLRLRLRLTTLRAAAGWLSCSLAAALALPLTAASQADEAEAVVASGAGDGQPPDDESVVQAAREHFQRGTDYYRDGDYAAALIEFERAHALRHTYRLLYNLGQVSYELRDYAASERYFRAYLVEGEDEIPPERRDEVMRELERLRERVTSLAIQTEPSGASIQIDERPIGTTPFDGPRRVSAGRRTIVAELAGHAPVRRTMDLLGGQEQSITLHFGAPLIATATAASDREASSNVAPWITGIASGVFAIGAGAVGYSAYRDSVAYDEALNGYTTQAELDAISSQAHTKAVITDVLLAAAAVSLTITAVLVLSSGDAESAPTTPPATERPSSFASSGRAPSPPAAF